MNRHNRTEPALNRVRRGWPAMVLLCLWVPAIAQAPKPPASRPAVKKSSPLAQAEQQLAHGDLEGAEAATWRVLSAAPNDKDALTLLGIIRGQQQRYPEAESLFRRVVQLDPASPAAYRNLANALVAQEKSDEAIQQYKEAARRIPGNVGITLALAQLYLDGQGYDEALDALNAIPKPRFPVAGVPLKAAALIGLGRKAEAAALVPRTNSLGVGVALAEVYLRARMPDEALRSLQSVPRGSKEPPAVFYYLEGRAFQEKGQLDTAAKRFHKALELEPKSVDALLAMAELSAAQKKHAESLAFLQQARGLVPDAVSVLRHIIVEAEAVGQSQTALDAARELFNKSPNDPQDLYLAGAAMLQGKDLAGAIEAMEKYTTDRTDDARGWLALGMAYAAHRRFADARTALERALQLNAKVAETEYWLGVVSGNESKPQEAVQHFERAVQLQPKHAAAWAKLGANYLEAGDLEKARDALQQSESANPYSAETEYKLSQVLSKLGETQQAQVHMQRFRQLKGAGQSSEKSEQPAEAENK